VVVHHLTHLDLHNCVIDDLAGSACMYVSSLSGTVLASLLLCLLALCVMACSVCRTS
jgi:hypothetical protein